MRYLLDTNICIVYLNDSHTQVVQHLKAIKPHNLFLCQIVKAELVYGAYKSSRQVENLALLERFFSQFKSLPFNDDAVDAYGQIRAKLTKMGKPIGPNDIIIASVAVAHDITLVTNNVRGFSRIPHLKIENWLSKAS